MSFFLRDFFIILTINYLIILAPHLYFKYFQKLPRYRHEEPYHTLTNLWTEKELKDLRQMLKSQKVFHTAAQDSTCQNEDLEVKVSKNLNENCPSTYLVPDETGKTCVLPGRVDMFRHYAYTGIQ